MYSEGGYGKILGNKNKTNLSGFLKIKLRGAVLRIVYQLIRTETEILIVVIGVRETVRSMKLLRKEYIDTIYRKEKGRPINCVSLFFPIPLPIFCK